MGPERLNEKAGTNEYWANGGKWESGDVILITKMEFKPFKHRMCEAGHFLMLKAQPIKETQHL